MFLMVEKVDFQEFGRILKCFWCFLMVEVERIGKVGAVGS